VRYGIACGIVMKASSRCRALTLTAGTRASLGVPTGGPLSLRRRVRAVGHPAGLPASFLTAVRAARTSGSSGRSRTRHRWLGLE
jgi:hypothetical protein